MPPVSGTKAATPQTAFAAGSPAVRVATSGSATPSSRPPPPANGMAGSQRVGGAPPIGFAANPIPPVGGPKKGFTAAPAPETAQKHTTTPNGVAKGAVPSSTPAANPTVTPGTGATTGSLQHGAGGSGYGVYPMNSTVQPSAYGYGGGSMYSMQPNGSMYPGVGISSMYGTQMNGANGMYNSSYGNSMMGPMGGPGGMGSMYGTGSMYGMGSMGGGYGFGSSFGGSLYGGTMYGMAGSLYGTGGSLYGSNDPQAIMGSMYGSRNGSIYGGFGSFYTVGGPHTSLGTVRKYDMPGFSYSFGSNLGEVPYHRSSFAEGASYSSRRDNSFRGTSRILQADEKVAPADEVHGTRATEREKELEEGKRGRQRGLTGVNKEGKTVDDSGESGNKAAPETMKDGNPESIVRKRTSVEAPKSPPSTRAVKPNSGATQAPVLSNDFAIHNVVVLEKGSGPDKVTKEGDACVLDGKSYAMDEVVDYTAADAKLPLKSLYVHDMIEHVLAGHNTALLVSDDNRATATATAVVESTVAKLMQELRTASRNSYAGVTATMCGLRSNSMMRDLLVEGALPKSMEVGNSPLFGPAIMNVTSELVNSSDDFNRVFEAALKRGERETLMVCMLTVKQVRNGSASVDGKDDVFLSSVFIGISRRGPREYHDIVDKVATVSHDFFRYAVDGPSVCVHVIALRTDLSDGQVLADCEKIGKVKNTAPRSGNVRRFVNFTEEQLKRMKERRDSATGAEKHEYETHVKRLDQILDDAKKLLADPRNTEARLYRIENEPASPATKAAERVDATTTAAEEEAMPRVVKKAAPSASPVSATASALAKESGAAEKTAEDGGSNSRSAGPVETAAAVATANATLPAPSEKPHSTNVVTVAIVDGNEARAYSVKGLTITAGGRPFTVDEVIIRQDVKSDVVQAKATDKVLNAFLKGYNGAVIASDSAAVAANGMASPTMGVVVAAVNGALTKEGTKGVRVSIALVRDTGKVADLTATSGAVIEGDIEISSSPLFGPLVHNATLHSVKSTADLQRLLDAARENVATTGWDEHCVVHVSVVHCFAEKEDVLVSSLLATFASNNAKVYGQVLQRNTGSGSSHSFGDLYRYAFGGAATTAYVVSVGSEDEVADVLNALSTQNTAGAVRNRSPRQGSINNFNVYTAASLQKRCNHLVTLAEDAPERSALLKVTGPMSRMLEDHKKTMEDPENNFPRAYTAEGGMPKEAVASPTPQSEKKAAKPSTTAATAARSLPSPSTRAAVPSPASAKTEGAAAQQQEQHDDPTASGFTEPRVVVFVDRDVAADEKKLSLGGKDYAVDEVVKRGKGGTGNSAAVAEMEARLCSVHNCALMSASSVDDATSHEEPVWPIFEQCLRSAMAAGKPGEDIRAHITFTVVSSDELLDDLLADEPLSAPRQLDLGSSPIYGPRVTNVAVTSVQNADELMHAMAKVHERAAVHMDAIHHRDAMMVGTAVVRRKMKDGDVEVASLMGTLIGTSMRAFHETLEKEQVARRMLLNCAYGGPCATITILNLRSDGEAAQKMVPTAVALSKKQRNLVSRSGSVLAFVTYTEGAMKRELARAEQSTGESKERHQQKAERLRPVVEDHKKLLDDFNAPVPVYPAPRSSGSRVEREHTPSTLAAAKSPASGKARTSEAFSGKPSPSSTATSAVTLNQRSAAETKGTSPSTVRRAEKTQSASPTTGGKKDVEAANRIHSVFVITPSRHSATSSPLASVEKVDEKHVRVIVAGAARECECDEAVDRADASSIVRADLLRSAAQQFVAGFNTALMCCDLGGSNAGPVSCVRAVHHAAETKPANAELYYAINSIKNGESRNMLQPDSGYSAMRVANSPVFGPWVDGAEMRPLTELGEFDTAFGAACGAAATDNAMVIVNLVLKAIQDDGGHRDVIVSGLLISLVADPRAYTAVVNAPVRSDRKLFQYAVQGSCFSVGLLGLSDKVGEEGLTECLDAFDKLRTIENRPMRNGSIRRFLAYSMNAVSDVQRKLPEAADERQRAFYQKRLEQLELMVTDSRLLLESPKDRALKVYL